MTQKRLTMEVTDEDDGEHRLTFREMVRPAATLSGADRSRLCAAMDAAVGSAAGEIDVIPEAQAMTLRSFVGYGALQSLSQDSMIRLLILTRTTEMLRKWILFKNADAECIEAVERFIKDRHVRDTLQNAVNTMGFMGGAYLFIDTGAPKETLINPLDFSEKSGELKKGAHLAFRVIDPIFTSPQSFNALNPLEDDFYRPSVFLVQGIPVHRSRLVRLVENEVSDILKPSYNFLGIPQAQILDDYVKDFRKNRESANRLLSKFSCNFIKTDLSDWLYNRGSRAAVAQRVRNFVRFRNNDGVALLDKESEDFFQANTPLSGVDSLVSQSLQFCVAINRTNVVKTLGLSPAGFNTGDSDIKVHNDMISSLQEQVLRKPLETVFRCIQLHLFGKSVDLAFDFNPLNEEDERVAADTQKVKADTAAVYLANGVITEDEARDALRNDEGSPFSGIEGDAPEAPEIPLAGLGNETIQNPVKAEGDKA